MEGWSFWVVVVVLGVVMLAVVGVLLVEEGEDFEVFL
jgi:hypothetical protein